MMADPTVHWMVETGLDEEAEQRLISSLSILPHVEFQERKLIPFGEGLVRGPKNSYSVGSVVYHGSLLGAKWAQENTDWIPGPIANNPQFRCSYYYPRLRRMLLNEDHVFLPFGCLDVQRKFLWGSLGEDNGCVFIRPDSNRKPFTGQLTTPESWNDDLNLMGFYDDVVTPELMCVVARPQNIVEEWRFFVQGSKVLTGSLYRKGPHTSVREPACEQAWSQARLFAREAAKAEYTPDPVWVMDLCRTKAGNIRLLEVGSFSCAGIYACDTDILAKAVTEEAQRAWRKAAVR